MDAVSSRKEFVRGVSLAWCSGGAILGCNLQLVISSSAWFVHVTRGEIWLCGVKYQLICLIWCFKVIQIRFPSVILAKMRGSGVAGIVNVSRCFCSRGLRAQYLTNSVLIRMGLDRLYPI